MKTRTAVFGASMLLAGTAAAIAFSPAGCHVAAIACSPVSVAHDLVLGTSLALVKASAVALSAAVLCVLARRGKLARVAVVVVIWSLTSIAGLTIGTWLLFNVVLSGPTYYGRFGATLRTTTVWSPGFSESRFNMVRVGWAEEQLRAWMGGPVDEIRRPTGVVYVYTRLGRYRDPAERAWHLRAFVVRDGKVAAIGQRYASGYENDYFEGLLPPEAQR
jgi:hypothetical protein